MTDPASRLIAGAVRCLVCNTPGVGNCRCWEKCCHGYRHELGPAGCPECSDRCSCGWWHIPGTPCYNPMTARCSSRVKYGRYDRKKKVWA